MSRAAAAEAAAAAAAAADDWLPPLAPEVGPRGPPADPSHGSSPPAKGYLSFFINVFVFRLGLENQ